MNRHAWAVNHTKYDRALKEVKDSGKPLDEAAIKAVYVRLAGLLLEEAPVDIQEKIVAKRGKK